MGKCDNNFINKKDKENYKLMYMTILVHHFFGNLFTGDNDIYKKIIFDLGKNIILFSNEISEKLFEITDIYIINQDLYSDNYILFLSKLDNLGYFKYNNYELKNELYKYLKKNNCNLNYTFKD